MATEGWPGAGSGLVGDAHREVLGRLVERFERIRAGDTTVARTIVLSGASGVGKSRIVREFYRHLQEAQPAPGYWPLLPEDDARQGHGSEVDPFPLRKVLGPETNGFVWSAGAFPSFTWWTFECGRTQGGGLRDTVAESRPVLELHLLPAMRSKAAGLGVGKKALGHMDALIARLREAGTEDAVEGVNQAITALGGAAVPGLGLLLDWTSRGIRAAGKASEVRALEWSDVSFGGMAEQSRRSVAEEFADLVLATAHPAVPALVIVEDAHQIDASVRTFLERMSTRAADRPTMVITTACPGGERNNSTYREWRTWETQYKNMEVCEVPDLAAESLVTLLRRSAPKTLDGDAHAVVARYPNPLALKLVLGLDSVKRAIRRNNGALPLDAVDLSGLPKTFKELYDKRIAELPPRVREAVIAAKGTLPTSAPTGPYAPGVVGAAAEHALEVPGKETAAGLADAVDDGLSSAVGGWHQFREALLAEVLAERVDPTDRAELQEATRRELRRHIAAARGDRYFLNRSSAFDVQVALWLTQLVDETPETVDDAVALITVAATLHDTYQYKSAATLLQKAIPQLPTDHPDTLAWRNNLAYAYRAAGDLSRAIPLFEATLTDSIRVLGPDHPSTLASRNNLAATYRAAGDLGRAIPLFEATLADSIRVLGPDHPSTLTSRNNLAATYRAAGDLGRAIPLFEATLADSIRVLGPDHANTLASRNNLASAYQAAGDIGRAIPLLEAVLADRVRVIGADHHDTLTSRNNLAGAYRAAGDLGRAIPLFEATLTDRTRVLGPDHPDTLASRNNLAGAYRAAGDLSRAIPLFEATLTDSIRVLGPDHPNTLASRNNLASAYRAVGDLGRAIPLFEATLADSIRVLGPDHPSTLTSRNNLASAYRAAGDLGRAIPLHEEALADSIRVLGPDHPNTLASRNNLAGAYEAAGDLGRAIPLFEATLADSIRVLGPDHPNTLASRNNLASAYESVGDLGRAIPLFEATLADSIRVLGPDHPSTLTSRNNLAGAYEAAGDLGRATSLYEEALTDRTRVLGPDHPSTLTSRNSLAHAYWQQGRRSEALAEFDEAADSAKRLFGSSHRVTRQLAENRDSARKIMDDDSGG